NQQILTEKQRAEASEMAKQQFLANMSHEIRTPMNAIKGMTDILLRRDPQDSQLSYLRAIKESSTSLLVIINDILDLSKVEAGKINLEKIHFDVRGVIDNVMAIMQFKAEEKGLLLISDLPDNLPAQVSGDPTRLHQVLLNLLGNAVKFTDKGEVRISLKQAVQNKIAQLSFCVSDTGPGIDPKRLEQIFESFEQEAADTTRKYGGTGLGLSISKKLVELQQGKIWVESELGKGSQFYVQIGYEMVADATVQSPVSAPSTEPSQHLKGIHILLAEDNAFNAIVAQEELEDALEEFSIEHVENGALALALAQKETFDIILMDVQMPVMDGYEASRQLKKLQSTPIIAMTANVMKEEIDRCFEAGMDDFISKPFEVEELLHKMAALVGRKSSVPRSGNLKSE
ncbi:MAG: ATP-binding protein, partial [Bacteroidota bacterium]